MTALSEGPRLRAANPAGDSGPDVVLRHCGRCCVHVDHGGHPEHSPDKGLSGAGHVSPAGSFTHQLPPLRENVESPKPCPNSAPFSGVASFSVARMAAGGDVIWCGHCGIKAWWFLKQSELPRGPAIHS